MRGVEQCCLIYITRGPLLDSNVDTHTHTHTNAHQWTHRKTERRETEMQVWLKQHIPLIFPFLLTLAPLNVTRGRVLSTLQISTRIHLSPAHSCPTSREARCSAPSTPPPPAARQLCCQARSVAWTLYGPGLQPHLHLTEIITTYLTWSPGGFCLKYWVFSFRTEQVMFSFLPLLPSFNFFLWENTDAVCQTEQ